MIVALLEDSMASVRPARTAGARQQDLARIVKSIEEASAEGDGRRANQFVKGPAPLATPAAVRQHLPGRPLVDQGFPGETQSLRR